MTKTGWLQKQSGGKRGSVKMGNITHHWDRRFFVLKDDLLSYYHSEAEAATVSSPPGQVNCAVVTVIPAPKKEMFSFRTDARVMSMRAASADEAREWMDAIVAAGGWLY